MPSKKKKYNARFPAGRIKKIMQTDEEVGKVAQAVPVIISRTLELFVESLLKKSMQITLARNAKTLTPSHMKQCILSESRFDFLKDLVKDIPDASVQEDNENNAMFEENASPRIKEEKEPETSKRKPLDMTVKQTLKNKIESESRSAGHLRKRQATTTISPAEVPPLTASFYLEQSTSTSRTPVIQYAQPETPKLNFSVNNLLVQDKNEPKIHITIASGQLSPTNLATANSSRAPSTVTSRVVMNDSVPALVPLTHPSGHSSSDSLTIDEDYDN